LFSRKNRDQALFGYWMYFIAFHFSCRIYMENLKNPALLEKKQIRVQMLHFLVGGERRSLLA